MITILKIGHTSYALSKGANVAAILKALSEAVEVRHCYSAEKPFQYRALHDPDRQGASVEVAMVDPRRVGPPDPGRDDYGEVIEKPMQRGLMLGAGNDRP